MMDNQNIFELIVESATEGIMLVDQSRKVAYANEGFLKMFGYQKNEVIGQDMQIFIPKSLRKAHRDYQTAYFHYPKKRSMGLGMDLMAVDKNGNKFPVEISLNHFQDKQNTYVIVMINNITKRKEAERSAKKFEQAANTYLELSKAMFVVLDKEGIVQFINEEGCKILGYEKQEIIDENWFDLVIPAEVKESIKAVFGQVISGNMEGMEYYENKIITKNNDVRIIEWHNANIYDENGQIDLCISSGVDITARKNIERLKNIAMLQGIETERKRLALELHDGLVQSLSAISMQLKSLESVKKHLTPEKSKAFETVVDLLLNAINEARNISHDLVPTKLEHFGLERALQDLIDEVNRNDGTQYQLSYIYTANKVSLDDLILINVYRIVQELIQNISKHARAHYAKITIVEKKETLELIVTDDGIGFEGTLDEMQSNGIGVRNIVTRVHAMRGKLILDSTKDNGVKVVIEIPLS